MIQVGILTAIGGTVWLVAHAESFERSPDLLYRHVFVPLVVLVGISLLIGAGLAAGLFRSTRGRTHVPERLKGCELFVHRPDPPRMTLGMLVIAVIGAVTSSPGRVLFLPALAALLVERPWVSWVFFGLLAINIVALAFANIDPRFNASWTVFHRWWFRGWSAVVSLAVIVLGCLRVLDFQYVSTIFDGARNWTLGGYLLGAYVLTWWWDYWSSMLLAVRFLDLLGGRGNAADARIEYPVDPGIALTSVPPADRVIQVHGAGRLLVLHDAGLGPLFHSYDPAEMADALGADSNVGDAARADLVWVRWRLDVHFLVSSIVLVLLLGGSVFALSRLPQHAHIASDSSRPGPLNIADTIIPLESCRPGGRVIVIAASGGGTRAAVYTTASLERLRLMNRIGDVRLVSGVSGGGASLAYFAGWSQVIIATVRRIPPMVFSSPESVAGDYSTAWPRR